MAICQSCGAEMSGQYCNTCGARAAEERAPKKAKPAPAVKQAGNRNTGMFAPQRIGRTTAVGLLCVAMFGAGTVFGFWLGGDSAGSPLTSTSTAAVADDGTALTPIAQAGRYMDEGVEFLNKGEKTSAVASFRKAIAEYERVIKAEPGNLYAKSYMGLTYYYIGDSNKAMEHLQEVLKQDEKYLWALFNLGWIYSTANKPTESLLMYQKYLAVVDEERKNMSKYAEQFELIDRQIEAAKQAVAAAQGGGK